MTATEADSVLEGCGWGEMALYKVVDQIGYRNPYGQYRVEISAVDGSGATGTVSNWFDVLPIVGLRIDFDAGKIDFGQLVPNTAKEIRGDRLFSPPEDGKPTVKNVGNAGMRLNVRFSRMAGAASGRVIGSFGARLEDEEISAIAADATATFQRILGPNDIGQLDLFVYPGEVPADTYGGTLTLWASR